MNLFTPSRLRHLRVQVMAFVAITLCLTTAFLNMNTGIALAAPPNAVPLTDNTNEDTAITLDTGIAVSSGYVVAISGPQPVHGIARGDNNGTNLTVTYEPADNRSDNTTPITFNYQLCTVPPAAVQCGSPATVSITVIEVNDPPVANPDAKTVAEDGTILIDVLANDNAGPLEGTAGLVLVSVSSASHGTAIVNPDNTSQALYTPALNYCGPDSFTYNMRDDSFVVVTGQVTINVTCVNDAPTPEDDTAQTIEDATDPIHIDVLANDSDPDDGTPLKTPLGVSAVTQPPNGSATTDGTEVTYLPDADYCNSPGGIPDIFNYTVVDENGGSASATVYVEVACVIDPPVLSIDGPNNVGEHQFEIDVILTSIDENVSSVQFTLDYANQCLVAPPGLPGNNVFDVPSGFTAIVDDTDDKLEILIFDAEANDDGGTTGFAVLAGPDPDAVSSQSVATIRFQVDSACSNDVSTQVTVDIDFTSVLFFDELINQITSDPANTTDAFTTPMENIPSNHPPTLIELTPGNLAEGDTGASAGTLSTEDDDAGDTHSYELVLGNGADDNGKFEIVDGNRLKLKDDETADHETQPSYSVRVESTDEYGAAIESILTINVNDLNERPIAVDDGTETVPFAVIIGMDPVDLDVLKNDIDPDGGAVTIQSVTPGTKGMVTNNGNNVTYTTIHLLPTILPIVGRTASLTLSPIMMN